MSSLAGKTLQPRTTVVLAKLSDFYQHLAAGRRRVAPSLPFDGCPGAFQGCTLYSDSTAAEFELLRATRNVWMPTSSGGQLLSGPRHSGKQSQAEISPWVVKAENICCDVLGSQASSRPGFGCCSGS